MHAIRKSVKGDCETQSPDAHSDVAECLGGHLVTNSLPSFGKDFTQPRSGKTKVMASSMLGLTGVCPG